MKSFFMRLSSTFFGAFHGFVEMSGLDLGRPALSYRANELFTMSSGTNFFRFPLLLFTVQLSVTSDGIMPHNFRARLRIALDLGICKIKNN